jgi:DNA-directed RNA polymerase subunit D
VKIDVLESTNSVFRFVLKDAGSGLANAIRRATLNSVKTFAIDRITFYENTSAMFDEYIAHRVGLVPIRTPAKGYSDTDEIAFNLDATGPRTVYSKELESTDKDVRVANENIPIMKLADGQRLRFECKAVMGDAKKHSKFQAGLVTYDDTDNNYTFSVESFGQMPPKEIVNKAFEAIKEELKEVEKEAKKL